MAAIAAAVALLGGAQSAHAASAALVPDTTRLAGAFVARDSTCTAGGPSPLAIDEDIDAPVDVACLSGTRPDDYIYWPAANLETGTEYELSAAPAGLTSASAIDVRLRGMKTGTRTIFFNVYVHLADGTQIGTATSWSASTSWQDFSYSLTGLNLTATDVDGLYAEIKTSSAGGGSSDVRISALNLDVTYTSSNSAPSAPTHVSPASGSATSDTTPTLTATYADPDAGDTGTLEFEVCTVAVAAGATCTGSGGTAVAGGTSATGVANGSNGTFTPTTALAVGTYHWHVRATDAAGATGPWSASWSVQVNTPPATPAHVSPSDSSATTDTTPTLTASYSDADGDSGTLEFELCTVALAAGTTCTGNGGTVVASGSSASGIASGSNGSFTTGTALAAGTYHWHVRATDAVDLQSNWSASWQFRVHAAPDAPVHVSPADASSTSDTTPTLTASHSDPDGDTGTLEFEACTVAVAAGSTCTGSGGTVVASGSSPSGIASGSNGSFTVGTALATGTYHWHARATDAAGAVGPWSASWQLSVTAPSISMSVDSTSVALPAGLPGVDATGTSTVSVTTDAANGYQLSATDPSDTWGMEQPTVAVIPDWTGTDADPTPWPAGSAGYVGVSVTAATSGKDTARWGTGTTATDVDALEWAGLRTTATQLHARTGYSTAADAVTVAYRANPGANTPPGTYSVAVAYTAVAVP